MKTSTKFAIAFMVVIVVLVITYALFLVDEWHIVYDFSGFRCLTHIDCPVHTLSIFIGDFSKRRFVFLRWL